MTVILYLLVALAWSIALGAVAWAVKDRPTAILALLGIVWPAVIVCVILVGAFHVVRLAVFDR